MTLDGFREGDELAFTGFRPTTCDAFTRYLQWIARALHVEVVGVENLPAKRALLVANHAFGWDIAFAMSGIRAATGRTVFALGEHLWWRTPFLRRLAAAVGTVDGTAENVDALLQAEQLVLVLPGGLREAMKPSALRYRLMWGQRYGFVRAAIRNRTPIVPVAALGADEIFDLVGDSFERGARLLGRFGLGSFPVPRLAHLPHRARLRYVIGEPIEPLDDVRATRWMVEGALHELLDRELAARAHVSYERS
jgi:1-acyl-sn-glycerol-3-phosphate acyltransferase